MPDPRIANQQGMRQAPQRQGTQQPQGMQQPQGQAQQDPMQQAQMEIAQMPRPQLEQLALQLVMELQNAAGGGQQAQPRQPQGQPMR